MQPAANRYHPFPPVTTRRPYLLQGLPAKDPNTPPPTEIGSTSDDTHFAAHLSTTPFANPSYTRFPQKPHRRPPSFSSGRTTASAPLPSTALPLSLLYPSRPLGGLHLRSGRGSRSSSLNLFLGVFWINHSFYNMSASLPGSRELPASQYDLSTYWGRARHSMGLTDPRYEFSLSQPTPPRRDGTNRLSYRPNANMSRSTAPCSSAAPVSSKPSPSSATTSKERSRR